MTSRSLGLVIVGAGSAQRMGRIDKTWADLGGHAVLWHSLAQLGSLAVRVVIVVRPDRIDRANQEFGLGDEKVRVVPGGALRNDSVGRGLDALSDVDVVAIHDAARPFATADSLTRGLQHLDVWDGAVPGVPVSDTIKRVDEQGEVWETVMRQDLRAVQTPQVFVLHKLLEARSLARASAQEYTDDAMVMENAGFRVGVFPGDQWNFKITTPQDLEVARLLLARDRKT